MEFSKIFYTIGFSVLIGLLILLDGCSADVHHWRGQQRAEHERTYKPLEVQIPELKAFRKGGVWHEKDLRFSLIGKIRRDVSFEEFQERSLHKGAFAFYEVYSSPLKFFSPNRIGITLVNKDDFDVYYVYKKRFAAEMDFPDNVYFGDIEYDGEGKLLIRHRFGESMTFSMILYFVLKLVVILIIGLLLSILLMDCGWMNARGTPTS